MLTKKCNKCLDVKVLLIENFRYNSKRGQFRTECRDCERAHGRAYNTSDSGRIIRRSYQNYKAKTDPTWRLNDIVRVGIYRLLKKTNKNWQRWTDMVGYDVMTLKQHLESQFKSGWTWDNHGKVWHIDHIKPLSRFNSNQVRECWALSNLRPLDAKENMSKLNKVQ